MENKPKIRTYDDPRLMNLKRAAYSNNVVKGLKETVRLIKAGRAEQVFVADNELGEKYTSIIKEYLKAYQDKYEQYPFYLDPLSSSIFTWVQQNDKNEICFQIGIGKLAYRPIMHVHDTRYELIDDKINVVKEGINDVNSFPYQKIIRVTTSRYSGYDLILKIIYDGAKYLIKIDDKMTKKRNVNIKIGGYNT